MTRTDSERLCIAPFAPADQPAARALILAGLEEHWGALDLSLNPDLDDIAHSHANGIFLVARLDDVVIGTGALVPEARDVARIVRMSVARSHRRTGIATRILEALLSGARRRGYRTIVLETTETWDDAIAFYLRHGFTLSHHADGDAHFELVLAPS
jgi:GNAT superfamily N-acetyltransferase